MATARPSLAPVARAAPLFVLALGAAIWTLVDAIHDPYVAGREHPYGHNGADAGLSGVTAIVVECAVLTLLLRPWVRSGRPRLRAALTLLLLAPYTLFAFVLCMHTGGVFLIHALWLTAAVFYVIALLVVG